MTSSNVVAIVQARMTSARLPGKVLVDLGGYPVLHWVTNRLSLTETVDKVIVATSTDPSDDPVAGWCAQTQFQCFRGSLKDVLARFKGAAQATQAGIVVRITADCPLVDPKFVDLVVRQLVSAGLDYCGVAGEFPDGLDCEAMTIAALERAYVEASLPSEREHVTPFLKRSGLGFRTGSVEPFVGLGHHRWTLDCPEDLAFLRAVVSHHGGEPSRLKTNDVLAILASNPELSEINAGIVRNEGYIRSREEDSAHGLPS